MPMPSFYSSGTALQNKRLGCYSAQAIQAEKKLSKSGGKDKVTFLTDVRQIIEENMYVVEEWLSLLVRTL